jgi:hypothetical protein
MRRPQATGLPHVREFVWELLPAHRKTAGIFQLVHGIAVDPVGRRVYVSDRGNRRIRALMRTASLSISGRSPSVLGQLYTSCDRQLWALMTPPPKS